MVRASPSPLLSTRVCAQMVPHTSIQKASTDHATPSYRSFGKSAKSLVPTQRGCFTTQRLQSVSCDGDNGRRLNGRLWLIWHEAGRGMCAQISMIHPGGACTTDRYLCRYRCGADACGEMRCAARGRRLRNAKQSCGAHHARPLAAADPVACRAPGRDLDLYQILGIFLVYPPCI